MAVPKKRMSSSRRDKRRANHDKITAPNLHMCPDCGELTMSHRICPGCGKYNGRQVVAVAQD
ncbi:MAG: 50S ribosomal protein L32 [Myxococcota bacterium]